jgi:hypothetical protein
MTRIVDRSEQQLADWLQELARADRDAGPHPDLEARTLAAWDDARARRTASPPAPSRGQPRLQGWAVAVVAAVAASLLGAVAIPWQTADGPVPSGSDKRAVANASARDARAQAATAPIASASPVRDEAVRPRPRRGAPAVHRARREPPPKRVTEPGPANAGSEPGTVETANFLPLGPDVERELGGSFQLARVRVSRDVLVDLGLLVDGHRGGEPVQADVVFGEDGLARAIRLTPVARSGRIP